MSIIPAVGLFVVTGRSSDDVDEALESELLRAIGLMLPMRFSLAMVVSIH